MQDRDRDIAMRALVNEAADSYNATDIEKARQILDVVVPEYIDDMDNSDLSILNTLVVMGEGTNTFNHVLRAIRKTAEITNEPAFVAGFRYFRAVAASGANARPEDFLGRPTRHPLGKHILIACIPKTGSTFLQSCLMMITNSSGPKLGLSYANEENMLHPETVTRLAYENIVAQEHCRATPQNLAIAQAFNMKVVVLVRNIFDNMVSMRDMLASDTYGSVVTLFQNEMVGMDTETQMDAIITKWAHWQLDFYTSWIRAQRDGKINAQFWTYEDVMYDKVASIREICRQAGRDAEPPLIQRCVDTVDGDKNLSRKNVGVSGRGAETLTKEQMQSVRAMTRFYPDIDFSPLGL